MEKKVICIDSNKQELVHMFESTEKWCRKPFSILDPKEPFFKIV